MKKTIKKISALSIAMLGLTLGTQAQWTETASYVYLTNGTKNVGIGTTTPAFALDLIKSGNANLSLKSTTGTSNLILDRANSSATSSVSYRTNGAGTWQTGTMGTNNFAIRNIAMASPAMTIDAGTNNIGIGTASPAARLHIKGTSAQAAIIDGGSYMYVNLSENGIYRGYIGSYAGSPEDVDFGTGGGNSLGKIHFTIQGIPKMTVAADGAVCINTTVPANGYKLSVNGKIMCEELRVLLNANWPDYVFSKNYDLMSLNDLQKYVDENNHLPGVKSAATVESDGGISVGEMQQTLLRKIEEANLYILQLNKRIAELEAQAKK